MLVALGAESETGNAVSVRCQPIVAWNVGSEAKIGQERYCEYLWVPARVNIIGFIARVISYKMQTYYTNNKNTLNPLSVSPDSRSVPSHP
jgi:hypothetical protein